ncbi:MAG: NAD(+)/NADH kinase, partial [Planctomycetota bacterium]
MNASSRSRPSVLVVGDRRKQGVSEAVTSHHEFLTSHLDVVAVDLGGEVDLSAAKADLILVFGGDGSILHVARRLGTNPIPVLGVNYGQFGFLADLEPEDLEDGVRNWLSGDFVTSQRSRLSVRFVRDGEETSRTLAFNDVVVGRRALGGMVDVEVGIDGRHAVTYSGDGLIAATATGSTAHALAAGGPLVEPTVEAVLLVPMAPHTLSARPLVLPASHVLQLSVRRSRGPGVATVDGQPAVDLERGDVVEISDARAPLTLVHASGRTYYDAIRRKLGWRGRPAYARVDNTRRG